MFTINTAVISGNLTRDPELRTTPSGTSVVDLGVAVNEREKKGDEWEDRANFIDVTVWGKLAEFCAERLEKGSGVVVSGRLRWESWEKDGEKRSKVKLVAEKVRFPTKAEQGERSTPATSNDDEWGAETPAEDFPF